VLIVLTLCFFALDFKSDTRISLTAFVSLLFYLFFLVCTLAIVETLYLAEGKGGRQHNYNSLYFINLVPSLHIHAFFASACLHINKRLRDTENQM
jgi:hypothetical protein